MTSSELLESKLLDAPAPKRTKARGDVFYLVMAIVVAAVVTIGFAPNFDARLLHPSSPRPTILYLHVAVSIAWVLLFVAQATLVRMRKVAWHRRLGLGGLVVGTLLPPLGLATAIVTTRMGIAEDPAGSIVGMAFFAVSCLDMLAFSLAFGLAIAWRRRPDDHKRLMLIATCCLLSAAFARFPHWLVPSRMWYVAVDLLILAGVAHDAVVTRSIHRVYRYALPILILGQAIAMWIYLSRAPAWIAAVRPLLA